MSPPAWALDHFRETCYWRSRSSGERGLSMHSSQLSAKERCDVNRLENKFRRERLLLLMLTLTRTKGPHQAGTVVPRGEARIVLVTKGAGPTLGNPLVQTVTA
jgi:hypothetical protein